MQALAADQPAIALPLLEHSPLLIDADLVDIVATGRDEMQCAIARRDRPAGLRLPPRSPRSARRRPALELIENPHAGLAPFSWDRIVERHGHLGRDPRDRCWRWRTCRRRRGWRWSAKLSDTLAQFVVARNWLGADRAERIAGEAKERSTVNIAARAFGDDMQSLITPSARHRPPTAGLILRACCRAISICSGRALAELSRAALWPRLSALLNDRGGNGLQALLRGAGLPGSTYAAFRVALEASHEVGFRRQRRRRGAACAGGWWSAC